jgi:uncharacterized protein (DUF2141 family)
MQTLGVFDTKSPLILLFKVSLFLLIVHLLVSCAQVSSPQGGPRDLKKPELVKSFPENQTTNFAGRTIRLEFDKPVQANDLKRQLLITPSVQNPYTFTSEKNFLELTFEKPLEENTTYFLNFREGVQDLTEKNKPEKLTLTFSTGAFLDSGMVTGNVMTLLTNQPEKNVDVLLYPSTDTVNIRKNRPYYVTKADDKGAFVLQNIKEGSYFIYALTDKNNNLTFEGDKENIAFKSAPIFINSQTEPVELRTERIDTKKPFVVSRVPYLNLFAIEYSEGLTDISLTEPTRPDFQVPFNVTDTGKNIRIYPTKQFQAGQVIVQAQDSAGNRTTDTLKVSFTGKRFQQPIKGFTIVGDKKEIGRSGTVDIEFEMPVVFMSKEPITLIEDTVQVQKLQYPENITLSPSGTRAAIRIKTKAEKTIDVLPDSTAVIGVTGEKLSFKPIRLQVTETPSEGSITGKINTSVLNYWVELVDERYKLVHSRKPGKTYTFQNLKPGIYYIRVKLDLDNDGEWKAGNPNLTDPADPIYFHPEKLEVRANWDLVDIDLTF